MGVIGLEVGPSAMKISPIVFPVCSPGAWPVMTSMVRSTIAVGSREVADRERIERGDLGHVVMPDERRAVGGKDRVDGREVAVADPDAGHDRALVDLRVGVGGQEAEGLEVA